MERNAPDPPITVYCLMFQDLGLDGLPIPLVDKHCFKGFNLYTLMLTNPFRPYPLPGRGRGELQYCFPSYILLIPSKPVTLSEEQDPPGKSCLYFCEVNKT